MKNQPRNQYGQFMTSKIRNGALYSFNGITVRAGRPCSNNLRLVSVHKKLFGFAHDYELEPIPKKKVNKYLKNT